MRRTAPREEASGDEMAWNSSKTGDLVGRNPLPLDFVGGIWVNLENCWEFSGQTFLWHLIATPSWELLATLGPIPTFSRKPRDWGWRDMSSQEAFVQTPTQQSNYF